MNRLKSGDLLEKTAARLSLPGEILAGLPKVEITGRGTLTVENHRGLLEYTQERIEINGGRIMITVRGDGMNIRSMSADALLVEGTIISVELDS